jgi:hypothetical protein
MNRLDEILLTLLILIHYLEIKIYKILCSEKTEA